MDDLSPVVVGNARGSVVVPSRRRGRRLGAVFAVLFLLSGPVGFWFVQMLAGLALFPLLFVVEHLGASFTWWQASLWFVVATLAWGALTWLILRGIGISKFSLPLLSVISMAWAVLPWVLFILATWGKGD